MSKLKLSFTLVIMLFLVGMFSAAASAATNDFDPSRPQADVNLTPDLNSTLAPDDATHDNSITNANNTGVGAGGQSADQSAIKSQDMMNNDKTGGHTQRTHGEYQNNTNSCASCHQTHTGASKNLLFKDGVYSTCTACHDGTLGFYNVFKGSTAGTFGGNHDASIHMANESLTVSAAPGGNRNQTGHDNEESWGKEFSCASCHSPHGSYSDRLLNYNPNNMGAEDSREGGNAAWSKLYTVADIATIKADVQTKYDADKNYNPKEEYGKFIAVNDTWANLGITPESTESTYTNAIVTYGFTVDHDVWSLKQLTTPLLNKSEYASPYKISATKLYYLTDTELTTDTNNNHIPDKVDAIPEAYTTAADATAVLDSNDGGGKYVLNYLKGYITGSEIPNVKFGKVARAYQVKLDLKAYKTADKVATFGAGGNLSYVSADNIVDQLGDLTPMYSDDKSLYSGGAWAGTGIAMSNYCAACHTDYLATSGKETGTFTEAYRHTTEVDTYTCVRCHFAHGTDREMMKDSLGRDYKDLTETVGNGGLGWTTTDADAWLDDKNSSSALKKFTNMAGCWGCHTSSHSVDLINNNNANGAYRNGGATSGVTAGWKE